MRYGLYYSITDRGPVELWDMTTAFGEKYRIATPKEIKKAGIIKNIPIVVKDGAK